jgi:hypothetical protein
MRVVVPVLIENIAKDYIVILMDNICIYSDTGKEDKLNIKAIMDTLQKHNFKLKN